MLKHNRAKCNLACSQFRTEKSRKWISVEWWRFCRHLRLHLGLGKWLKISLHLDKILWEIPWPKAVISRTISSTFVVHAESHNKQTIPRTTEGVEAGSKYVVRINWWKNAVHPSADFNPVFAEICMSSPCWSQLQKSSWCRGPKTPPFLWQLGKLSLGDCELYRERSKLVGWGWGESWDALFDPELCLILLTWDFTWTGVCLVSNLRGMAHWKLFECLELENCPF